MQFNTYLFILAVFPITIVGYFLLNKIRPFLGKVFLVVMSVWFYGYAGITEFKWLLLSIVVNYLVVILGQKVRKCKKLILWCGILFNVALLFYFKYFNFTINTINGVFHRNFAVKSLVLPLGISFFTFQQIAYLVDAYKGKLGGYCLLDYILYVVYFPKVLMGPIVKPEKLLVQFHDESRTKINPDLFMKGIRMFNIGLFKKVILADTFAKAVSWGFADISATTSMDLILVMLSYTFQIYFDFSGYSDMAIGVSDMLNIELPMNFDSPYKAFSIRDFWKRWHMSLTGFLTEYVYFPLGGSRKGKIRTYVNTVIVFLVSGIWHGANWTFILWGILHGILSVVDRLTEKMRKNIHPALQWMVTFGIVNVLWLLFRANSISEWMSMMSHIGAFKSTAISDGLLNVFVLPETGFLTWLTHTTLLYTHVRGFSMLVFFSLAIVLCLGFENAYRREYRNNIWSAIGSALLFVFSLTCIGSESVFVYFNF